MGRSTIGNHREHPRRLEVVIALRRGGAAHHGASVGRSASDAALQSNDSPITGDVLSIGRVRLPAEGPMKLPPAAGSLLTGARRAGNRRRGSRPVRCGRPQTAV